MLPYAAFSTAEVASALGKQQVQNTHMFQLACTAVNAIQSLKAVSCEALIAVVAAFCTNACQLAMPYTPVFTSEQ
jgi:hypothetical protein